jgi:hypothetical protein
MFQMMGEASIETENNPSLISQPFNRIFSTD